MATISDYNILLDSIDPEDTLIPQEGTEPETIIDNLETELTLFTTERFIKDVRDLSNEFNKKYHTDVQYMSSYDIASNCIREIIFKLLKYQLKDYASNWLPIMLRASLGNAVHDFIQSKSTVFTEQECSLKIPSIRISGRLDCLINNNVLVEIKSCTYDDFHKIITKKQPRISDFYQCILYKYLLENHLKEAQSQPRNTLRSDPPKLDKYDIHYIQFIYVAHNVFSQNVDNVSDALKQCTKIKQSLKSRYNKFHFISAINIDLTSIDIEPYYDYITNKIKEVNYYIDGNKIPLLDNQYVKNNCFFCLYNKLCKNYP